MLRIDNLKKKYDSSEALRGISFAISSGEIYGLLGPNGAGKSTAINIIAGILAPTSGSVTVSGYSIASEAIRAKSSLGVVLQEAVLVEELSALQNCMFFGSLYNIPGNELKKRSKTLLSWIGLSERMDDAVSSYSGGMKRRLSLVLGIMHEPKVLVLDEPTVGLDPQTRLMILESISEIAGRGTAVLFSTHYLEEAERICGRIGIIDNGLIIKEGSLQDLRRGIENVQILTLHGSFSKKPVEQTISNIDGAVILLDNEMETVVSVPSDPGNISRIFETVYALSGLNEVSVKPPSLESLFISLTGRKIRE